MSNFESTKVIYINQFNFKDVGKYNELYLFNYLFDISKLYNHYPFPFPGASYFRTPLSKFGLLISDTGLVLLLFNL